jgi:hypothetical protein
MIIILFHIHNKLLYGYELLYVYELLYGYELLYMRYNVQFLF